MINKISSRVSIPLSSCSQEEDSFCVKHSSHWWNRKGMRIIRPCFSSLSDSKYKIPFVSISSNSSFSIWYSQYPCGEPDFCCPNSFLHVLILSRIHCYIGGSILDNSSFKQVKVDGRGNCLMYMASRIMGYFRKFELQRTLLLSKIIFLKGSCRLCADRIFMELCYDKWNVRRLLKEVGLCLI